MTRRDKPPCIPHPPPLKPILVTSLLFFTFSGLDLYASTIILTDDFNTTTTPPDQHRVYDSTLDSGWKATTKYSTHIPSAWDITGGTLQNPTNTTTSYVEGETPVWQWWTNPLTASGAKVIEVCFDYNVGVGDTLTAHFWAVQSGGTPGTNNFITNNQGWANGNSGQNQDVSSGGYDTFNLLDGDTTPDNTDSITGALTGTGTFTWTVDVSTLGITGVNDVGDINTFFFGFAMNETGGGTTSIDNLRIVVPEPSTAALLSLSTLGLLTRRKHP